MERIIIIHWNKSTGPEPIIQYPPEKPFPSKDTFLKIWAKYELNKDNKIIDFYSEETNKHFISVIQYYEGELYFFIIDYKKESIKDYFKDYPEILAVISRNLVELINTNKITRAISEAFNTLKNYYIIDLEDNLLNFFQDRIKNTILKIFQNGVISKSELIKILREEYGFSTINIDLLLISFLREKLIIKKDVPGRKECYFLIKDITYIRLPPRDLPFFSDNYEKLEETDKKYRERLKNFYNNNLKVLEIENKDIIKIFIEKDVLELLKNLRSKILSIEESLNILNNKNELFNELIEKNIIYEAQGFVYIFSDIRFIKFTPFYIIQKLQKRYLENEISFDEYLYHLELLIEEMKKDFSYNYEII
ncbi:MAG: hypothetical protein ACTSQJ_16830 [Promethearchaeota archaeon]